VAYVPVSESVSVSVSVSASVSVSVSASTGLSASLSFPPHASNTTANTQDLRDIRHLRKHGSLPPRLPHRTPDVAASAQWPEE
jgi:hypothetical protein